MKSNSKTTWQNNNNDDDSNNNNEVNFRRKVRKDENTKLINVITIPEGYKYTNDEESNGSGLIGCVILELTWGTKANNKAPCYVRTYVVIS